MTRIMRSGALCLHRILMHRHWLFYIFRIYIYILYLYYIYIIYELARYIKSIRAFWGVWQYDVDYGGYSSLEEVAIPT